MTKPNKSPLNDVPDHELRAWYETSGLTMKEIGRWYKVPTRTVCDHFRRRKLLTRKGGPQKKVTK